MKTILLTAALAFSLSAQTHWVGTWAAAPAPQPDVRFHDQTLREIVHVSIGGDTVRVRLSNAFGPEPVDIGAAHLALRESGASVVAASDKTLTFSGRPRVQIPAGALGAGFHASSQQTSWLAAGNVTNAATLNNPKPITSWAFLTGVDVLAPASTSSIVAFGDSITDGARSTVDANHRWPDTLAARLRKAGSKLAVVDMGIGGNRILHEGAASKRPQFGINALARFDSDVLAQPGVKYLVILEGINDIGHAGSSAPASETVTAEDIIAGLTQMIERAHEKGIRVILATITPFEGEANIKRGYWTAEKAKVRDAVNVWIRSGKGFDGFIDFDKAVRDPAAPNKVKAAFDSGDQLHPSDAGYHAMGEAIDLALFR